MTSSRMRCQETLLYHDLRAEFAVEEVGRLGDDHGGGDQWLRFAGQ